MSSSLLSPKTYGGFHRPKGFGIWIFGPVGTVLMLVLVLAMILLLPLTNVVTSLVVGALGGSVLLLLVWEDRHHQSMLDRLGAHWGFARSRRAGSDLYLPGTLTHFGSHRLPGVLSESTLQTWTDQTDTPFTILQYPKNKLFVVNFLAEPDGASLIDQEDLEAQVDKFGKWLANLANSSKYLMQAAITVETSQDSGPGLTLEMQSHASPQASELSRKWAVSLLKSYPQGATTSRAYISLSFRAPDATTDHDGHKIKKQDPAAVIGKLISERLPHLLESLNDTGAGTVMPMSVDDVIKAVRCAYNPADWMTYDQLESKGDPPPVMLWDSVGPAGSKANWDHYQHSNGASITWEVSGFVNSRMISRALMPILEPTPDVVKRITFLYKPIDPAFAGTIAETDHRAAEGRITNAKNPTARQHRQLQEADAARTNEALGAALINFAILVTATVQDLEHLPAARAAVEHQGPTARLILRSMNGVQDSAFAQGVGTLGLVTQQHLNIPTVLSDGI